MSHSHSSHMMCHTCMFKLCHVSVVLFRNLTAMLNLTSLSSSKLEREKWSRYNVCTIDRLAWLFFLGRVSTCTCMYVYLDPWVRVRKGTFMYLKYIVCSLAAYLLRNVDCVYTVTLFFHPLPVPTGLGWGYGWNGKRWQEATGHPSISGLWNTGMILRF